mgnify:CR=1 FL=1
MQNAKQDISNFPKFEVMSLDDIFGETLNNTASLNRDLQTLYNDQSSKTPNFDDFFNRLPIFNSSQILLDQQKKMEQRA